MTPQCQNCDAHITEQFYRVFYSEGAEVTNCVHCPEETQNGFTPPETRQHDLKG